MSSRTEAQEAIAAGLVTVDGAPALKPATQVLPSQAVVVLGPPRRFVSRGGEKLVGALEAFGIDPTRRRCLDAGISTGGFTDCLLQHGAGSVFAVDVGYGQVHERLRRDPRVEIRERTNVRELTPADVPPPAPDLLVADLSFISLALVLPVLSRLVADRSQALLLVKPQFEAHRDDVGRGGVVRDPRAWRGALSRVVGTLSSLGWRLGGVRPSPLLGPAGNVEFLVYAARGIQPTDGIDVDQALDAAVAAGQALRSREEES